ncbi:CFEM domain-containing protein [Colletotrichum truncatum]|uniref:CFEM domain-containing protein n=1 Tax=Colletotrichum truncatum TaxID=5467 RepID=A0ACC3Z2A3_COLTU
MICVVIRLYSKSCIIRRFGTDDCVITITCILYIGWFSIGHHIYQLSFGIDIWWADEATLTWALKQLFYIEAPIYLILLGLTKVSILCFYLRLFPYEGFCRLCHILLVIVITTTTLWAVLAIVQCRPISYNWEGWKGDFEGQVKCVNLNVLSWTSSVISITLDAIILIMPMPLIIKVKSTARRKIAIISMFSLGIVIIIASCLRLRFNLLYGDSVNITWDYVDLLLWTGVEVATSIAVTSLPAIRLMLHRLFPGLFNRIFAFGGHVERDREQYMEILDAHNRDIERLGANGIIRRLTRTQAKDVRPPTIGGGTPRGRTAKEARVSAGTNEALKAKKPAQTDASRILASIMGSEAGSRRQSHASLDESNNELSTVMTDITSMSGKQPSEDMSIENYMTGESIKSPEE